MSTASATATGTDIFKKIALVGAASGKVISRAGNRALTSGLSMGLKLIVTRYNVKQKDLKKNVIKIKMNAATLSGALVFKHFKGIPLFSFAPKPKRILKKKPKDGISVEVFKGRRRSIRTSFLAVMKSTHKGVYKRTGKFVSGDTPSRPKAKKHEKIRELFGPSLSQMVNDSFVDLKLKEGARISFKTNLLHEVEFELKKQGVEYK